MRFSKGKTVSPPTHRVRRWLIRIGLALLLVIIGAALFFRVLGWGTWPWNLPNYDLANLPKFATSHHIDMDRIYAVSKFRSGAGHDASDSYESCRSMKHYFAGSESDPDPSSINIYAPFDGTVVFFSPDGEDVQTWIRPDGYPNAIAMIFHTVPDVKIGQKVKSGQRIGHHSGKSWSDIQIAIHGLFNTRHVSYFDVMTDDVFGYYAKLGFKRSDFIIDKAQRDANPLQCNLNPSALTKTAAFKQDEPRDKAYVILRKDPAIGEPSSAPQPQPSYPSAPVNTPTQLY